MFVSVYEVQAFDFELGPYCVSAMLDFFDTMQVSIEQIDHHEGTDIYPYVSDSASIRSSDYQAIIKVSVFDRLVSPSKDDMVMQAINMLNELGYDTGIFIEETIAGYPGVLIYPEEGLSENRFVAVTWLVDDEGMADTNVAIVSEYPWGSTLRLIGSIHFEKC